LYINKIVALHHLTTSDLIMSPCVLLNRLSGTVFRVWSILRILSFRLCVLFLHDMCVYFDVCCTMSFSLFMATLCTGNRAGHIYFHPVVCSSFFLDVGYISTHGAAFVRI